MAGREDREDRIDGRWNEREHYRGRLNSAGDMAADAGGESIGSDEAEVGQENPAGEKSDQQDGAVMAASVEREGERGEGPEPSRIKRC